MKKIRGTTKLIKSRIQFREELTARIQVGYQLKAEAISTESELEELKKKIHEWSDYNSELLKQSFNDTDNEYKYKYDHIFIPGGLGNFTLAEHIKQTRSRLGKRIQYLESLNNKMDLISVET
jgi:hypothetical protein